MYQERSRRSLVEVYAKTFSLPLGYLMFIVFSGAALTNYISSEEATAEYTLRIIGAGLLSGLMWDVFGVTFKHLVYVRKMRAGGRPTGVA